MADKPPSNPFEIGQKFLQGENWQGMMNFCLSLGNSQAVAWAKGTENDLQAAFNSFSESINTLKRDNETIKDELKELRELCRENSKAVV